MDYHNLTIEELRKYLSDGKITAYELTDYFIGRIKKQDEQIGAFLEVFDQAYADAKEADKKIQSGENARLLGIPIALKDNILVQGQVASAASRMLETYEAVYSATVVRRLKEEGAIILGRTNMDEFAMGSSTENSAFQITKNPNDLSRVPGGSSGGSAASVAAGFAPAALGTDTGGSVRQPASFCGIYGMKPSYGAISRFGLIAMGSSLDQAGPLTKSVSDMKIIFDVLRGSDKNDSTTVPSDFLNKNKNKKIKTIGVPTKFLDKGVSKEVVDNFNESINYLKKQGYSIKEIELESFKYALSAYYIIMPAEVSTNLARFDGLRYGLHKDAKDYEESFKLSRSAGFGVEVKRRILLGSFVLSSGYMDAYYYKAIAAREYIKDELRKVFETVDAIITPTSPSPAFKIGAKSDPLAMYAADIFTVPVNIAGVPAISCPSGFHEVEGKKLPLAVQFIAPEYYDLPLLDLAESFEKKYAQS